MYIWKNWLKRLPDSEVKNMNEKELAQETKAKHKKKISKDNIRRIVGISLIVGGLIAIISAIVVPIINRRDNDKAIKEIRSGIYADDSETATQVAVTAESVQPVTQVSVTPVAVQPSARDEKMNAILADNSKMGIIEIEKIDVLYAIVEGTEDEQINRAVGHLTESVGIGEKGNCVLAGHRGGYYGTFFERLPELESGDVIKLTDLNGREYQYVVYDKKLVDPADWSVIENVGDLHTLTLITCEDDTRKRYIVFATLFSE